MDRRSFIKGLIALATAPAIGKFVNVFKTEGARKGIENVASQGVDFFNSVIKKVMDEGTLVDESDRIQTFRHPDRPDIDVEVDADLRRDASYYGEITSWNQSKLCWDVQIYDGTHFLRFDTLRRLALVDEGIGAAIIDGIEFFNRPPFVSELDRIGGAEALLAGAVPP